MQPLTRRFLITAAGFLIAGVALGLVLLVRRELLGRWPNPFLVSAHTHLILAGAVLETILGVALWLFPRSPSTTLHAMPRSAMGSWWSLTTGTVLRALAEGGRAWSLAALRGRVRAGTGGDAHGMTTSSWMIGRCVRQEWAHGRARWIGAGVTYVTAPSVESHETVR